MSLKDHRSFFDMNHDVYDFYVSEYEKMKISKLEWIFKVKSLSRFITKIKVRLSQKICRVITFFHNEQWRENHEYYREKKNCEIELAFLVYLLSKVYDKKMISFVLLCNQVIIIFTARWESELINFWTKTRFDDRSFEYDRIKSIFRMEIKHLWSIWSERNIICMKSKSVSDLESWRMDELKMELARQLCPNEFWKDAISFWRKILKFSNWFVDKS